MTFSIHSKGLFVRLFGRHACLCAFCAAKTQRIEAAAQDRSARTARVLHPHKAHRYSVPMHSLLLLF
jgi:hypothetical protein